MLPPACFQNLPRHPPLSSDTGPRCRIAAAARAGLLPRGGRLQHATCGDFAPTSGIL
jgi:hypothetical protein